MSRGSWNSVCQAIGRAFRHTTVTVENKLLLASCRMQHRISSSWSQCVVTCSLSMEGSAVFLTRLSHSNGGAIYTEVLAA